MRIIKLGFVSFVIIFAIVFLISLLIPSHIRISKATDLPARRDAIFSLLKAEEVWHPAYLDSASAPQMQALKKTLVEQSDSTLVYRLQQEGRRPVTSGWQLHGAAAAGTVTLQWYMDFSLGFWPWQKFSSLFYEQTYGAMMERGLANFKKRLGAQ